MGIIIAVIIALSAALIIVNPSSTIIPIPKPGSVSLQKNNIQIDKEKNANLTKLNRNSP
jgi:hypothetical protein